MNCEDRSGFLFAHECTRPATVSCTDCGKHLCALHLRGEGGRPLCVKCAAAAGSGVPPTSQDPYAYGLGAGYVAYDAADAAAFGPSSRSSSRSSSSRSSYEDDPNAT